MSATIIEMDSEMKKRNLENLTAAGKLYKWLNSPFQNNQTLLSGVFALSLLVILGCTCSSDDEGRQRTGENRQEIGKIEKNSESGDLPRKVESYEIKGFKFSYYLIPKNLSRDELIETAQKLHDAEPERHLILIDDESGLSEYVEYAREFSSGNTDASYPKDWVNKHLVANVQKNMDGSWYLCEGNLYEKIVRLD